MTGLTAILGSGQVKEEWGHLVLTVDTYREATNELATYAEVLKIMGLANTHAAKIRVIQHSRKVKSFGIFVRPVKGDQ